jgi:hypothetical protein
MLWIAAALAQDTRDPYGLAESLESEHFVLRWGEGVGSDEAEATLEELELGWRVEVEELGFPEPPESRDWKLNVYVADSAASAPGARGARGYYARDEEGHPMLVLSAETVADVEGNRGFTTAHELNHLLQDGIDGPYAYGTGEPAAWLWEATATWVDLHVHGEATAAVDYAFGWTFFPDLPLDDFQYPDGVALEPYHAYGSFLFLEHLELERGPEAVVALWTEAEQADAVEVLASQWDLGGLMEGFAVRGALLDFPLGQAYEQAHQELRDRFEDQDRRVEPLLEGGWEDWELPGLASRNHVWTGEGDLRVRFEGGAAFAVLVDGRRVELDSGDWLVAPGEVWIVAASVEPQPAEYSVRVDSGRACGCSSARVGSLAWPGLLLVLGYTRRRIRSSSGRSFSLRRR